MSFSLMGKDCLVSFFVPADKTFLSPHFATKSEEFTNIYKAEVLSCVLLLVISNSYSCIDRRPIPKPHVRLFITFFVLYNCFQLQFGAQKKKVKLRYLQIKSAIKLIYFRFYRFWFFMSFFFHYYLFYTKSPDKHRTPAINPIYPQES